MIFALIKASLLEASDPYALVDKTSSFRYENAVVSSYWSFKSCYQQELAPHTQYPLTPKLNACADETWKGKTAMTPTAVFDF